jgi:glycerophosphoryl diester phosphodiesterase
MRLRRDEHGLIRVGHRGAAALADQNTLRSFAAAVAAGVDAIEFDVLDLADGPLVLAHSNDLREVSHGAAAGTVRDRSLAELREVVPDLATLEEALAFLAEQRGLGVHVDLKVTRRVPEVAEALRRHALDRRSVVSSFHRPSLDAIRRAAPNVCVGLTYPADRYGVSRSRALRPALRLATLAVRASIARRVPAMIARGRPQALMLHHAVVSSGAVRQAHAAGAAVWAWTVDHPVELARVTAAGVDAVITNNPEIFDPCKPVATLQT